MAGDCKIISLLLPLLVLIGYGRCQHQQASSPMLQDQSGSFTGKKSNPLIMMLLEFVVCVEQQTSWDYREILLAVATRRYAGDLLDFGEASGSRIYIELSDSVNGQKSKQKSSHLSLSRHKVKKSVRIDKNQKCHLFDNVRTTLAFLMLRLMERGREDNSKNLLSAAHFLISAKKTYNILLIRFSDIQFVQQKQ